MGHRPQAEVWLAREMIEHCIAAGCPSAAESTRDNIAAD
jgi:hypothetical protein